MAYRPSRTGVNGSTGGYDNQSMFMEQQNDALAGKTVNMNIRMISACFLKLL
jgi:hypothetical protein